MLVIIQGHFKTLENEILRGMMFLKLLSHSVGFEFWYLVGLFLLLRRPGNPGLGLLSRVEYRRL